MFKVAIRDLTGQYTEFELEFDNPVAAQNAAKVMVMASNVKYTVIFHGENRVGGYGKDEDGPVNLIF